MILENFAQSFMKVIANKAKTKDEHISDFYNDVIVKTKHQKNTDGTQMVLRCQHTDKTSK